MTTKSGPERNLSAFLSSAALAAVCSLPFLSPPGAAAIVANLVSNLAVGYASGKIDPLLERFSSEDWSAANFDLDRGERGTA
jgi:hypothetical protein